MAFYDTYTHKLDKTLEALFRFPFHLYRQLSRGAGLDFGRIVTEEKIRGRLAGLGVQIRFLPYHDAVVDTTPEMQAAFRQMLREPAIKAPFLTKILSVAALTLTITPASKSQADRRIADFCQHAIRKSRGGSRRMVWNAFCGGLMDGYSISEKVWQPPSGKGEWGDKLTIKCVKGKDTRWLDLYGDEYKNVTAIVDRRSHTFFNPSNFLVYQHLPIFESPTGMSDFRAAYRSYWLCDTAWKLRGIALDRYTLPMMLGKYSDPTMRPSLEEQLALARSQSWMTIPEGAQVEAMQLATSAPADFQQAISDLRQEMFLAIVGAFLQSLEGSTPSGRGNSETHKSTTELLSWMLAEEFGDLLNDQLLPDLVDANFAGADYPTAALGAVDTGELLQELQLDQGLQAIGVELSKADVHERYHRVMPTDANDVLKPPGQQAAPNLLGQQAGSMFWEPKTNGNGHVNGFSEQFCQQGPNAGKPGPCPDDYTFEKTAGREIHLTHPEVADRYGDPHRIRIKPEPGGKHSLVHEYGIKNERGLPDVSSQVKASGLSLKDAKAKAKELLRGAVPSQGAPVQPVSSVPAPGAPTPDDLTAAFRSMPGAQHNLVHLGDLREKLGMAKADFDRYVKEAQRIGVLTLSRGEGRHGKTERDRAEEIELPGADRVLYGSLREHAEEGPAEAGSFRTSWGHVLRERYHD